MNTEEAYGTIAEKVGDKIGWFYGPTTNLGLGAGMIYTGIRFPLYDENQDLFVTVSGAVYVLTHECDVEQDNARPFNDDVAVCPIIEFGKFVKSLASKYSAENLRSFLENLVARKIFRLAYMPPLPDAELPYGGVLFLNRLTHTKASAFKKEGAAAVAAVSAFGLREIDSFISNHFFREKADLLALSPMGHA